MNLHGKGGTATKPARREDQPWIMMHEHLKRQAEAHRDDAQVVFLGDSITQGWNQNATWQEYYAPRHALNFGIGGDRTQHVLWRIDHGELDPLNPRVVVLSIGTNNLDGNTDEETVEGIKAVVSRLRSTLPNAKILLLGLFPRGKGPNLRRDRIKHVNEQISQLDREGAVTYLDIGNVFLEEDGTISKDVMPDALHLSEEGYRRWAEAMEPTLSKMLEH